jgi:hypothetical protein
MYFRLKVGELNRFLIICREPQEQPVNHIELQKEPVMHYRYFQQKYLSRRFDAAKGDVMEGAF